MIPREELLRALTACQPVALWDYPALRRSTRRMLLALDRYWVAYEGGSGGEWDALWWGVYERERAKVEALLAEGAR